MHEQPANVPASAGRPGAEGRARDLGLLLVLTALAVGIRAWHIGHTEVTARDSVGFIRFACQLRHDPAQWKDWLHKNLHPPVYPLTILAASVPVRYVVEGPETRVMQISAQVAASAAGVLLVIPMFLLGRTLFGRGVGFWAAALFQCMPYAARAMSDGLSEAVFLLLTATSVLFAVHGFRTGSLVRFGLCGLCGGLAYLARPEGLLSVAAPACLLLAFQAVPAWRRPWPRALACASVLGVCAVAVGGPYVAIIGRISNKPTTLEILKDSAQSGGANDAAWRNTPDLRSRDGGRNESGQRARTGPPKSARQTASLLAFWSPDYHTPQIAGRLWWSFKAMAVELVKGFHYVVWLPALLGLWWFRSRLSPSGPAEETMRGGGWAPLALCLLHLAVLWRVTAVMGYLSDRHILLLVMLTSFWAVAAVKDLPRRAVAIPALARACRLTEGRRPLAEGALLVLLVAYGLPSALKPLHTNRAGHHAAGLWLAEHAGPSDVILDPACWAEYYAGKAFLEETAWPLDDKKKEQVNYVVLAGSSAIEHVRLLLTPAAEELAAGGKLVYSWPDGKTRYKAEPVRVYYIPREARANSKSESRNPKPSSENPDREVRIPEQIPKSP